MTDNQPQTVRTQQDKLLLIRRPNLQRDHPWAKPRQMIAMIRLSCTVTEI